MAFARIVHDWGDGSTTALEVGSEEVAHPDLLDELVARVVRMWRDICEESERDGDSGQ